MNSSFSDSRRLLLVLVSIVVFAVLAFGVFRAYAPGGGGDFAVFFEAWKWVYSGKGMEIYRSSPDRYLYSPAFAWVLSPFAFFSKDTAFLLWCLLKVGCVGFLIRQFARHSSWMAAALGIVFIARPLLIDFHYGQVNVFILSACVWALMGHFEPARPKNTMENKPESKTEKRKDVVWDILRWSAITFAGIAKLFPLPLLLVPWVVVKGVEPRKLRIERVTVLLSIGVLFLIPWLSVSWNEVLELMSQWRASLLERGLPMESHNQSFTALLYRYFSGQSTHILSEGYVWKQLGQNWLSGEQIQLLSYSWLLLGMGLLLGFIVSGPRSQQTALSWIAIVLGLLIVPSHLIWKPYFIMSFPLVVLMIQQQLEKVSSGTRALFRMGPILLFFLVFNFTTYDFVGHEWGARFEAGSALFLVHLVMIGLVLFCRVPGGL